MINVEYTNIVTQKQNALGTPLPESADIAIKKQITTIVDKKVTKLNSQITHTTRNIKDHLHNKLNSSFLDMYSLEYPLIFASLATTFIFKKKKA